MLARTRRILKVVGLTALVGVATVATLIVRNPAPQVPELSSSEIADTTRPYVIKLHAQWCPVCMLTKDEWAAVQTAYPGKVRFVVFDFTGDASSGDSRLEAQRLGLSNVFESYNGETGTVLVVDGASKEVRQSLHGHRDQAEYRAAIDAELARVHR